jgi:hypothetical protein
VESGKEIVVLKGHADEVPFAASSPDKLRDKRDELTGLIHDGWAPSAAGGTGEQDGGAGEVP